MKKIKAIIVGAGGQARVVLDILKHDRNIGVVGIVDNIKHRGENIDGVPIIGPLDKLPELAKKMKIDGAIVAVGDNVIREKYFKTLKKDGFTLINAIHPTASIADSAEIGEGVVICREAIISVEAKVGDDTIINSGSILEHQDMIGNHVHIAPGVNIAGKVKIGNGAFIGIGSTIIQNVKIGGGSIIGAGSVVIKDIPDNVVAV